MNSIENNLLALKQSMHNCEKKFNRALGSVSLLAVSKGQSLEKLRAAIDCGQLAYGESYLQEALPKILELNNPSLEWHFIGPLQSNKIKKIAENFDFVQSVATKTQAKRLNDYRPAHLPVLNVCIQVNVSQETTKSGANSVEILDIANYILTLPRLRLRGLMTIPKKTKTFAEARNEFRKLSKLFTSLKEQGFLVDILSMGMSEDFEAAIAEGSTLVRIGTAIFGDR